MFKQHVLRCNGCGTTRSHNGLFYFYTSEGYLCANCTFEHEHFLAFYGRDGDYEETFAKYEP